LENVKREMKFLEVCWAEVDWSWSQEVSVVIGWT